MESSGFDQRFFKKLRRDYLALNKTLALNQKILRLETGIEQSSGNTDIMSLQILIYRNYQLLNCALFCNYDNLPDIVFESSYIMQQGAGTSKFIARNFSQNHSVLQDHIDKIRSSSVRSIPIFQYFFS